MANMKNIAISAWEIEGLARTLHDYAKGEVDNGGDDVVAIIDQINDLLRAVESLRDDIAAD